MYITKKLVILILITNLLFIIPYSNSYGEIFNTDNNTSLQSNRKLPQTFVLDPQSLYNLKQVIHNHSNDNNHIILLKDFKGYAEKANRFLKEKPLSVIEKKEIPPSGDKHDFLALSPYHWLDPTKPDGLPYVPRDGLINPEANSIPDLKNLRDMIGRVYVLSTMFYLTDNSTYASKAGEFLRVWFLDNDTHMNPNLDYGEVRRGGNDIRPGIMAGKTLVRICDALQLIKDYPGWTAKDKDGMKTWFEQYLDWLLNSPSGKIEAKQSNNHRTHYDLQVSAISLFLNKTDLAKKVIQVTKEEQIPAVILPDGKQPLELKRTKALEYSIFNLAGLFKLANIGQHVGIDLWNYKTGNGSGLQTALDFILPFVSDEQSWPYSQIEPQPNLFPEVLCLASIHYKNNDSYLQAYKSVSKQHANNIDKLLCSIL